MIKRWFTITALIVLLAATTVGEELTQKEIDYEADFIIKVVDFVTWPDKAGKSADGAITIAVVGESNLTTKLQALADSKNSDGTKIIIKTIGPSDDLSGCQILYLPSDDKADLAKVLKSLKSAPILTISDAHYFANYGVMVNFFKDESSGKTKFEVNTMVLKDAGLKMSSKLLKLAKLI